MSIPQRKITAPSFKFSDIDAGHRLLILAGSALTVVAALMVGGGTYFAHGSGEGSIALAAASNALTPLVGASEAIESGIDYAIADADVAIRNASIIIEDVGSPSLVFGAKGLYSTFQSNWQVVQGSLKDLGRSNSDVIALRAAMNSNASQIANIVRLAEGVKRQQIGGSGNVLESANRVLGITESNYGARSAGRIEYEIRMLAYLAHQLADGGGSGDVKSLISFVDLYQQKIVPLASTAKANLPSKESYSKLVSEVRKAGASIPSAMTAVTTLNLVSRMFIIAGFVLLIAGLASLGIGCRLAMHEFGTRFNKSHGQFRRYEVSLGVLLSAVSLVSKGDLHTQIPESDDSRVEELSKHVRAIVDRFIQALSANLQITADIVTVQRTIAGDAVAVSRGAEQINDELGKLDGIASDSVRLAEYAAVDVEATAFNVRASTDAVRNAIRSVGDSAENMQSIRTHVQETAKRIKRIGERTQETVGILEHLATVAQQIEVVALNAELLSQRLPDEDGAAFQVISVEVRKVSGHASTAISQISSLMQALQAESREAIDAMERSTAKVVSGSYKADLAATSLGVLKSVIDIHFSMVNEIVGGADDRLNQLDGLSSRIRALRESALATLDIHNRSNEELSQIAALTQELQDAQTQYGI